jgi:hypothetical protein
MSTRFADLFLNGGLNDVALIFMQQLGPAFENPLPLRSFGQKGLL